MAELEEERRKHEHDTAQGDDVTYALEKDRTRLKQVGKVTNFRNEIFYPKQSSHCYFKDDI